MADQDTRQQTKKLDRKPQRPRRPRAPKNQFRNDDDFNWGNVLKVVLSWSMIILGAFLVTLLIKTQDSTEYPIEYTYYLKLLGEEKIESAEIRKSDLNNFDFHGKLREAVTEMGPSGKPVSIERFVVTLPYLDGSVIKELNDHKINYRITKEDNTWMNALLGALPWILILVVWLVI